MHKHIETTKTNLNDIKVYWQKAYEKKLVKYIAMQIERKHYRQMSENESCWWPKYRTIILNLFIYLFFIII